MEAAGLGEEGLVLAQSLRQRRNCFSVDSRTPWWDWMPGHHSNRLEGRLPADSARRGHVEMAAQDVCMKRNVGTQGRAYDIVFLCDPRVGAVFDPHDVSLPDRDALGEEKARSEFEIVPRRDRKSTRLNSSHQIISYAVFCLKKKKTS